MQMGASRGGFKEATYEWNHSNIAKAHPGAKIALLII